ncbi:MAG: AAA family ATPase [Deltaproteobacteria bacterium]|jgi:hypothetical protein|nr:AAA family ATPase [Deltaproteobacteria bacterium]
MFSGGEVKPPVSRDCWEPKTDIDVLNAVPVCVDEKLGERYGNLQGYMDISNIYMTFKQMFDLSQNSFSVTGKAGVCRSSYAPKKKVRICGTTKEVDINVPQYFTYLTKYNDYAGLALFNMLNPILQSQYSREPLVLTAGEMKALGELLEVNDTDFKCISKQTCPGLKDEGTAFKDEKFQTVGEYAFNIDFPRLTTFIAKVDAADAATLGGKEKKKVILAHLRAALKKTHEWLTKEAQGWQSDINASSIKEQGKINLRALLVSIFAKSRITFTDNEVAILKDKLGLIEWDMIPFSMMLQNGKKEVTGPNGERQYTFMLDYSRMQSILNAIETADLTGISSEKIAELKAYLTDVRDQTPAGISKAGFEKNDANMDRMEAQGNKTLYLMLAGQLLFIGVIMREDVKKGWNWLTGKGLKGEDYRKHIQGILKANPQFKIIGRMEEAKEAWGRTDNPDFRGIIIDAGTGEGKDATADAMLVLKEQGDASVPKDVVDAPVVRIGAADFQSNTKYRGTVADKVSLLKRLAKKGPVVVYISEIDLIFASGTTSDGESENVSKLLLSTLEDPAVKKNLVIIGTTSRGGMYTPRAGDRLDGKTTMLDANSDLERRFNWLKLHTYSLQEVIDITTADNSPFRSKYADFYKVDIPKDVMEAVVKVAEHHYRGEHSTLARFPAVEQVINATCRKARNSGSPTVTMDHVREGISELLKVSIDPVALADVVAKDAAQLEKPVWDGSRDGMLKIQSGEATSTPVVDDATQAMLDELPPEDKKFVEELMRGSKPIYDAVFSRFAPNEVAQLIKVSRIHFESCDGKVKQYHVQQSQGMSVADVPVSFITEIADVYTGQELVDMSKSTDAILTELHAQAKPLMASDAVTTADTDASLKTAIEEMIKKAFPDFTKLSPAEKAQFMVDLLKTHSSESLRRAYFPDGTITEQGITKFADAFFKVDLGQIETMLIEKDPTFLTLRPQRRMVIVKQTAKVLTGSITMKAEFSFGGEKAYEALDKARRRSAKKAGGVKVGVMFAAGPKKPAEAKGTATPKGEAAKRGESEGKGEGKPGEGAKPK